MDTLTPKEILENAAAPYWIKKALSMALLRDPLCAMNEAALLAQVLRAHALSGLMREGN